MDADIDAPEAWERTIGRSTIVVAVIDSGINLDHDEFVGRLWTNTGETAANGIDDDLNGYVDDIHGWNFTVDGPGNAELVDNDGHGTAVASIIAAEGGLNSHGIAGICWLCRLMVLKVDLRADGTYGDIAHAINYAQENGARVINVSLGLFEEQVSSEDRKAITYALRAAIAAGVTVVASAGNENTDHRHFPSRHQDAIAVGATDRNDQRWVTSSDRGSNYGFDLDLMAPGNRIPTASPGNRYLCVDDDICFGGTSAAAPHVAGAAALLLSLEESLSPHDVREILLSTTDQDIAINLAPGTTAAEDDSYFIGAGRLNLFKALSRVAFSDVRYHDWFNPYVSYAFQEEVINGFSDWTYRPADPASRAEVLQMAYAAAGESIADQNPSQSGFADVQSDHWAFSLIADAREKEFIEGGLCAFPSTAPCFFPDRHVNRAEALKMVSELFRVDPTLPEIDSVMNIQKDLRTSFPDVSPDEWYSPFVHWMANSELDADRLPSGIENGQRLIGGYPDNSFRPESLVNRAEMAKIVVNTMLYCRTGPNPRNCDTSKRSAAADSKAVSAAVSLGVLHEQGVHDPDNLTAPAPIELPGGNEQIVTGPFPFNEAPLDADEQTLSYFWQATGGTFTTSDPVNFSHVTWNPPVVTKDTLFTLKVVSSDGLGLQGRSAFRFLVPASASNSPASGTITGPNGTQIGNVTVSASATDPDGLSRVTVTFVSGGPELVLCGPDGPSTCTGTSGAWSRTGINPASFGAASGTVTMRLFVEDAAGNQLVDTHAFTFSPPSSGPTFKLTINKFGAGAGTVSGGGLVCGPGCSTASLNLPAGSSVTLTGAAATGSIFLGFMGDRCFGIDPCTFTLLQNLTVGASFSLPDTLEIRYTSPSNGDTGVANTTQININFNRDIAEGPNFSGIVLRDSGGTPVPFTPVIRSTDRRLVLIPGSSFAPGTSYVVAIPDGAVSDTQGNPLPAPYTFMFTAAVAGTPKMYISAYPPHVMEGDETKVSIWFEAPVAEERTITLTSTPEGELFYPSEVFLAPGEILVEVEVDSRFNHGSTNPVTVTFSASTPGVGQQSVQIVVANNTSTTGNSLKWQAAGVTGESDGDGVFEAGEIADILFEVANFGSATISNVVLEFSVINSFGISILGGAPFTCNLGSLAAGQSRGCEKSFRADDDLPTDDYFIQVRGTSSANSFIDQARIRIVNNLQPDFALVAGTFPSAELQPGAIVEMRYTARNLADGFTDRLVPFEVTLDLDGNQHLLYQTYANARGYIWNEQTFRLPLVVPPVPGTHTIRARINPPGTDRIQESNFSNNDAALLTLRVAGPNLPPEINHIPGPLAAQAGRTLSFTISASDPNNDSVTYRLAPGSPAGATIGSTSGAFNWTPACSQGFSSYAISVIAEDAKGGTDTETITIDVGIEADLAVTHLASSETAVPGESVGFMVVVTNQGPSCVAGAKITDTFPASLTNISWSCLPSVGSECTSGGTGNIVDAAVSLAAGGTATYSVAARVTDSASGLVLNSAAAMAPSGATDPVEFNDSASATITLLGLDFGDAPSAAQGPPWSFSTRLTENGARHGVHPELRLGAALDSEPDGQPGLVANGDDILGAGDEDGVGLPAQLVPCQGAEFQVTASAPGFLDAWVDFNTDGDWGDAGERIATSRALSAGVNSVAVTVPCHATPGGTAFARFRFSSAGNLSASGLALDGEVEDHSIAIAQVLHRLTVTRAGAGLGTVTASPSGINCGLDCTEDYLENSIVTLAAIPSPGSLFAGWTGAGCSGTGLCTVTMDAAKEAQATFGLYPLCSDRLEGGAGNWLEGRGPLDGGLGTGWVLVTSESHSPTRALAIVDEALVKDRLLVARYPVVFGEGAPQLRFWQLVTLPETSSGGVLEYSMDNGLTWFDTLDGTGGVLPNPNRFVTGGYNLDLDSCCSSPLTGRPVWTGPGGSWHEVAIDMRDFIGRPVLFRWRMGSGTGPAGGGWWIDDVTFAGATACPIRVIFSDDFESGGASNWSAKSP